MKSCCFSHSATSPSCGSVNFSDATFTLFLGWLSERTFEGGDGGGVTSLLRLRLRLRLTTSSSECSDAEFGTEDGGVTSFPFFFLSTILLGMRFPFGGILGGIFYLLSSIFFYLLSSSIFWLFLSSDFFYLLSVVVCSVAFCKWIGWRDTGLLYTHSPPGLVRGSSGSHPGYSVAHPGIPWLIRGLPCLVRGIPCLVLGYSVTRPGNMGSPGVVRELSGSIPWLVRVHFTIRPKFHDPGLSSVTNPWLFRVLSRRVPGKCSFHPEFPADTLRAVPGPNPGKWDLGYKVINFCIFGSGHFEKTTKIAIKTWQKLLLAK